jgi:hypothetical protein
VFVASTTDVVYYAESRQTSERAYRLLNSEIFIATNRLSVAFGTAVIPILVVHYLLNNTAAGNVKLG